MVVRIYSEVPYNNLAHIQEKGWNFLIRIKDGTAGIASGLALPAM